MGLRRRCLIGLAIAVAAATGHDAHLRAARDRMQGLPRLVLWAWERPEDLRGVKPNVAVAYLAATHKLSGRKTEVAYRRQPLRVDPGTSIVAVVRIETDHRDRPLLDDALITRLASEISGLRNQDAVRAIQIDFDATESERPFYRDLLAELRRQIGSFPLSITALASWCAADRWFDDLPIDEAVPMLFRMGPAHEPFLERGAAGTFSEPLCRDAVGMSTDEATPALRGNRRVYIFHPRSWTPGAVDSALARATRWQ